MEANTDTKTKIVDISMVTRKADVDQIMKQLHHHVTSPMTALNYSEELAGLFKKIAGLQIPTVVHHLRHLVANLPESVEHHSAIFKEIEDILMRYKTSTE